MKKAVLLLSCMFLALSCGTGSKDLKSSKEAFEKEYYAIFSDESNSEEDIQNKLIKLYKETYLKHKKDSFGLKVFIPLITGYCSQEEARKLYDEAEEFIRENATVKAKIQSFDYIESVAPGNPYKEVVGVDAISGDSLALSSIISRDKPTVLDFWASWCSPCRDEIKNNLLDLAAKGEVKIVGIAVWEKSIDNTRKAMEELGIPWTVIYTGGRENSPSIYYGVLGVPTLFLVSPEGIIQASGHSIEELGL